MQAEREAVENGLPWPGSSAAEAALREHFSGEEGTKAVEQQVWGSPEPLSPIIQPEGPVLLGVLLACPEPVWWLSLLPCFKH